MLKKISLLLVMLFSGLVTSLLFGQVAYTLDEILPADVTATLQTDGKIQLVSYREKAFSFSLFPKTELGREAIKTWQSASSEKPVFIVESLFLYKKRQPTEPGAETEKISRIMRSISSLEGIEYYSHSRKKMRTFYEESYVVDKQQNRIADPVEGSADEKTLLAMQKDLTFGKFLYEYSYRQTEQEVSFVSKNVDTLTYSIFKLVKPGNMKVSLVVTDLGEYLLSYGLVQADFTALSSIEKKLTNSFSSRSDAMYNWFIAMYEGK